MKTIKSVIALLTAFFLLQSSFGQATVKKQTIKVYGECGQCKKKIEKSAMLAGASYADWNEKTKQLTVGYDPSVSNPIKIETAIAGAGYDTQDVRANDSAYDELDKCCQYDRKSLTSKSN